MQKNLRKLSIALLGGVATAAIVPLGASALDEIKVTAERREASIQDVPLAVSAFTAEDLATAGITTAADLTRVTPGLNFAQSTYSFQPTVRGIGTRGTGPGDESTVAVYVDGVYQPDQFALNLDLDNLERIEVLKGPQGTLFGRNATAGAINVIMKQPSFEPEGNLNLTYGRFDHQKISGRYSAPLSDKVAFQVMGSAYSEDGYLDNISSGEEFGGTANANIRGTLLFKVNDRFDISFTGVNENRISYSSVTRNALDGNASAQATPGAIVASKPYEVSLTFNPFTKVLHNEYNVRANYDLGPFTTTYIGAYVDNRLKLTFDNDLTNLFQQQVFAIFDTEAQIHDLQFTSNGDSRLKWIAGVNYYDSESPLSLQVRTATATVQIDTVQQAKAISGYVEGTFEIVDNLFATAGVRYTDEEHDITGTQFVNGSFVRSGTGNDSFTNTSPHASLRYDWGHTNVYVSYSEGFKSGLYNGTAVSTTYKSVQPELIKSYELGVKSDLSDKFRVNVAGFFYDYTDLQVQASQGSTLIELLNAAEAEVYGLDADLTFQPTESLTLRSGVSLLNTEYTSFPGASAVRPKPGTPAPGNDSVIEDATGNDLIRAPEYTVSFGADWTIPAYTGNLTLSGNVFTSAEVNSDVLGVFPIPSYTLVSATATWVSADERLRFILSGDNLTDDDTPAYLLASTSGVSAVYRRPAFVSLTMGYSF